MYPPIEIRYPVESYRCPRCQRELPRDGISDDWKCLACSVSVMVYAQDGSGRRQVVRRISARDLREEMIVVLPTGGFEHVYPVIEVRPQGGSLAVALRGYRIKHYDPVTIVECVEGTWGKAPADSK
jgi:DNA-directed RNA polymerase subunit RPC12/RpoP